MTLTPITVDCGQYLAVLYEQSCGDEPVGIVGPCESVKELAAAVAQWITEGLEWEAARKGVIIYRPEDVTKPNDVDITLSSYGHGNQ